MMAPGLTIAQAAELLLMLCHAEFPSEDGEEARHSAYDAVAHAVRRVPKPWPTKKDIGYCVVCRGIYTHRPDCQFVEER